MKIRIRNEARIALDIALVVLAVLMYDKHAVDMTFHEIGGLVLCGLFVIHNLFNFKWIATVTARIFKKSLPVKTKIGYAVDALLFAAFVTIAVSGVMISKVLFNLNGGDGWKTAHYFSAAAALLLVGVHVGLHWSFVTGVFKKIVRIPPAAAKPLSLVLVVAIVVYGGHSLYVSGFGTWISAPFSASAAEGGEGAQAEGQGKHLGKEESESEDASITAPDDASALETGRG